MDFSYNLNLGLNRENIKQFGFFEDHLMRDDKEIYGVDINLW